MSWLLPLFVILPLGGYLLSLLLPAHQKNLIFWWAFGVAVTHFLGAVVFALYWLTHGSPPLNVRAVGLFLLPDYTFSLDFYCDKITLTYLLMGALLTPLVVAHSRYYLHHEESHKRFFSTVLCFYLGYILVILAGNFVTMLIGYEILALASFLLVALYRKGYPFAKKAVHVFSLYRLGDVGIILALWMSYPLGSGNVTFYKLATIATLPEFFQAHALVGVFVSIMILGAAAVKSAQVPFSWWLPRAMEHLPPAGAALFAVLSVHLGIFLLLRGGAFWENQLSVRILIGLVGMCTSSVATLTARVQSSLQTRIAYSSIAQIGLIFIEVAADFPTLALLHVAGNAVLRAYQLLYSPFRVAGLSPNPLHRVAWRSPAPAPGLRRIAVTLYMMSLKEWDLDELMYRYLWNPVKWVGQKMNFLTIKGVLVFFFAGYLLSLFLLFNQQIIPWGLGEYSPGFFVLIGMILVLKAFTEQKSVWLSWLLVILSHFWIILALCFNKSFDLNPIYYDLGGVVVAGGCGLLILGQLSKFEKNLDLGQFYGYAHKHPKLALVFLIACLGLAGFPIGPTFIGEDLLLTHISERQVALAFMISLCFVMHGLALIRLYALVFLGPHDKSRYERTYRSS